MDDRLLAFKILSKIEYDKAYSNIALDHVLSNNQASSAPFVCSLVYGVIERKITLDYFLSQFLSQPLKKLNPQVLTILRMGTYQLKFMDKVPVSAAVNESVKLVKKAKCSYASGLVNSVLRKIASEKLEFPQTDDKAYDLSISYSCPQELVLHYINDYGYEDTEKFLEASLGTVPLVIRVNTLKTNANDLQNSLEIEGIETEINELFPHSLIIKNGNSVFKTEAYKNGLFHAQDYASQICVEQLNPQPNDIVFDMCASPGGKSFTMAEMMNNKGEIYAFDLYEHRVKLINDGANRCGISIIKGMISDSSVYNKIFPLADKILCDVPCSGLGVIRRKPEIKYKNLGFVDKLCDLQYNILNCASKYLNKNGVLVYSTCSLNKKENQQVCNKFLLSNPDFKKIELTDDDGYMTLMPHKNGTDGFFVAKFTKG